VLQCVAVRCSVLLCGAVSSKRREIVCAGRSPDGGSGGALQRVAVYCSALQCVAVCCNLIKNLI